MAEKKVETKEEKALRLQKLTGGKVEVEENEEGTNTKITVEL